MCHFHCHGLTTAGGPHVDSCEWDQGALDTLRVSFHEPRLMTKGSLGNSISTKMRTPAGVPNEGELIPDGPATITLNRTRMARSLHTCGLSLSFASRSASLGLKLQQRSGLPSQTCLVPVIRPLE